MEPFQCRSDQADSLQQVDLDRSSLATSQLGSETCLSFLFILTVSPSRDQEQGLHWTDVNHRSLLAIVVTAADNSKHLLHLEDVSKEGHSHPEIVSSLKQALEIIPTSKINAIVSDNASNCVSARKTLVGERPFAHLIQHRCIAHWLNLIGSDLCKQSQATVAIADCNSLAKLLCCDSRIAKLMDEAGAKRVKRAVPTRWYTTVTLLESLLDVRSRAIDILSAEVERCPRDASKANCLNILQCADMWPDMESLVKILRPLADCIAVSESLDGTIGRTMRCVLEFARNLFKSDWDEEFHLFAIKSFLTYFSNEKLGDEMSVLLAAYFLDRTNKMDYVTDEGSELAFQAIVRTAKASGFGSSLCKDALAEELYNFCNQQGSYGSPINHEDETAEEWWLRQPDRAQLKRVALRLTTLKSSSANVESFLNIEIYSIA